MSNIHNILDNMDSMQKTQEKPSNTAIKSMHQIITQTNKLIKSDNVHQLNRMAIINGKLPDITMISDT